MQFNSYIFILAFLPLFAAAWFLLGRLHVRVAKLLIIAGGVVFYLYGGIALSAVLGASILLNWLFVLLLRKKKGGRIALIVPVLLNVGLLLYYKYSGFAVRTVNGLFGQAFAEPQLALPLGISFFTFQQIMYLVYARDHGDEATFLDYLCCTLYFPRLIMGPLQEPAEFISQLNDPGTRRINWDNMAWGLKVFSLGLFKKMLLADTFAKGVAWGFSHLDAVTAGDLFLVMLFYTFEIYFDFSGYSDMATGISSMLNISLPINFDSPYKALSIRDFWKRWHMSLTGFLTRYVYYPLGGSRKGAVRTYLNIMLVFLVSGIWHGADWTFILWGVCHGLLQVSERLLGKRLDKLHEAVRWMVTFLLINLLWLLFRAESVTQWTDMLYRMFTFGDMQISAGLLNCFALPETAFLNDHLFLTGVNAAVRGFPMLMFIVLSFAICLVPQNNYKNREKPGFFTLLYSAAAFVWAFLCLSSESVFVYFNF